MSDRHLLPGDSWVEWQALWHDEGLPLDVWTQSTYNSFREMQARLSQLPAGTKREIKFRVFTATATDWQTWI